MPKTTFATNTIVTAEFLNAINNPVFRANPDNDGEIPLITNADLSDTPGDLKPEWEAYRDNLKALSSTGLSVNIAAGSVLLPNGTVQTYAPAAILVADNATSFIYINKAGTLATATTKPVTSLAIASVVASLGEVTTITDLRTISAVAPDQEAVKVIGGGGDEGVLNITSDTTLDLGEYYLSSFTVANGVTVTIPAFARIFVSGDVNIAGTINVTSGLLGGSELPTSVVGTIGNLPGAGAGSGSGGSYNYALQQAGSGGNSGFIQNASSEGGITAAGGNGGGGLVIESGGVITITGNVNTNGDVGGVGTVGSGTPDISGGGGGSGGLQLYKTVGSITATAAAVLQANGGGGGNANSGDAYGGGGGGGGRIVFLAPSINVSSATMQVNAGALGTGVGNQTPGIALGGGQGGGFGGTGGGGNPASAAATAGVVTQRTFAPVA